MELNKDRDNLILEYFNTFFKASTEVGQMNFLEGLRGRVDTEMNESISNEFGTDEVYLALNQMNPTKAPGPDGMEPIFYKKILECIWKGCDNYYSNGP